MRRALVSAAIIIMTALAGPAGAQTRGRATQPARRPAPRTPSPFSERVRIVIDGGALINPQTFTQSFTLTKNVEDTPVATSLKAATGGFIEAGARVRVTRMLWVGAVGFAGAGASHGALDAKVPHPFYFNQPRTVNGDLTGLRNSTGGLHVELAYPVALSRTRELMVFGGPSYVTTTRALVTDLSYTESYPYDTAEFSGVTKTEATKAGVGFNVGADMTWQFSRSLRVGGMLRYSVANLRLTPAAGNLVEVRAGGLQIGGGVRILIQKRLPRPARPAPPRRR